MTEQERFENEVNEAINNFDNLNAIKVCDTPQLLLDIGFEQKPWLYSKRHLHDALTPSNKGGHGLTEKQIYNMPQNIANPCFVLKNRNENKQNCPIIIFDDVNDEKLPLFLAIKIDGKGNYNFKEIDSNFIKSLYGHEAIRRYLNSVIKHNGLIYYNKEKVHNLETLAGVQFSDCISNYEPNKILQQIDINVNNKNSNKGENNIMENEKKKAMWVTIPERYIHEFTKEFTSDQKGNVLPEPITKKYYAVNIPTKDGKNMSFFVNAKVQHPQVKNYAIIPINEGERGVTFSHLEKDENGKNSYVKEEPVVKLSQAHLSEIVKEAFSKINDEAIKYLIVPNSSIDYRTKLKLNNDTLWMDVKEEWKIIVLPDYMQDYQGHKLAGATMLAPFQYENTKDENLAVFRIDENATIELWENGDRNKTFNITGKELIDINKSSYKESKKESSKENGLDQEELPTLDSAGNIRNGAVKVDSMINGKNEGNTQENTNFNENKGDEFTKK